jgi:hypothetical protein
MKTLLILVVFAVTYNGVKAQQTTNPCSSNRVYRQFDFWLGEWEVFGKNGQKAGESKIDLILDSCIILENWTSAKGGYAGKSFNTYNAASHQWQQTWVDNRGGTTEYLRGTADTNRITFYADTVHAATGKSFQRRLTFYKINTNTVRQHGERSVDSGTTWTTEYDLEYRRRK